MIQQAFPVEYYEYRHRWKMPYPLLASSMYREESFVFSDILLDDF